MRILICFILLFTLFSKTLVAQEFCQLEHFKWLEGKWKRTDVQKPQMAFEEWKIINDSLMTGIGYTLEKRDTVFIERLSIVIKPNGCFYVADVSHNDGPVSFRITSVMNDGFNCKNDEHDFPNFITYQYSEKNAQVRLIGGGKEVYFKFKRL